jgi:hypothetical protein
VPSVKHAAWSLCALVACARDVAHDDPPSPSPPPPVARPVARPACMTQSPDQYPPNADSIAIAGDDVRFCYGVKPYRSCWHVDAVKRVFEPLPTTDAPEHEAKFAQPPHATAEVRDDSTIELCAPGGSPCKPFHYGRDIMRHEAVGVSDDLALVAIPDNPKLRVYDVATGKQRFAIHGWTPESMGGGGAFRYAPVFASPNRLIVWDTWTPVSDEGHIFDLHGKQLAVIGKDFSVLGPDEFSWQLAGSEWAFLGEQSTIVTVDVQHPEVTAAYDVAALMAYPRPPKDADTGFSNVLGLAGNATRLVMVTGENPATVGVLDRMTRKLVKLEPPRCRSAMAALDGPEAAQ